MAVSGPDPKLLRSKVLGQTLIEMVRVLRIFARARKILPDT